MIRQQKAYLPVSPIHTTSSARKFSRVLLLIGIIVAFVLISIIGTLIYKSYAQQNTSDQHSPPATALATPIHLNQSYMGTAKGFANGTITFSLISEDQQGNVSLGVTFTLADNNRQANYTCQGKVTNDRHITLQCSQIDAHNFKLDIEGIIFQDGHLGGTMVATDSSDASYHHNYTWNAT